MFFPLPFSSLSCLILFSFFSGVGCRTAGVTQSDLSKEFGIKGNNIFYILKKLETRGLIVRQATVVKTREASGEGKSRHSSIVTTNMLHLYRYAKHLGCQQRIEIIKEDKPFVDTDIADVTDDNGAGFVEESVKEDVNVKDYIPAMKAICDKLEHAEGKVSHLYYHESTSYVSNLAFTVFVCVFFLQGSYCLRY